jgi:hypothetical protein
MGGADTKDNLVRLTAKEHFMAHKLLVRMHPEVRGLWLALVAMGRIPDFKARVFASERTKAAEMRRGFKYSDAAKQKMSESAKRRGPNGAATTFKKGGVPWNAGMKAFRAGYSHTTETRAKMTATQQANREAHSALMKQWWADRKAATSQIGG